MMTFRILGSAYVMVCLAVACSNSDSSGGSSSGGTSSGGACGDKPIGSTCKTPTGSCEDLVCTGTSWGCPTGDTEVPVTGASGCGVADAGGTCGDKPIGSTCKTPAGDCESLVCTGTTWGCPTGDTQVPVTGASGCATPEAGSCGDKPLGSTCKKPAGDCESLVCTGSSWICPEGDTQVPVTPGNCLTPDGG
jgi:hypothetical protein